MLEIRNLIDELNKYRNAYYNENKSLISDKEYDEMYDRLRALEENTGIIYADSPTHTVGYEVISKLNKVKHNHPLLSLDKTTDVNEFVDYFANKEMVLMAKMDGLTCSITYRGGELVLAESRGNGEVGEDITHNALVISNLPKMIPFKGDLVIDGECIIDVVTFEKINKPLIEKAEAEAKEKGLEGKAITDYVRDHSYANPRNLASGTMRQLNSEIAAQRGVKFVAWKLHSADESGSMLPVCETFEKSFNFMWSLGFMVVPYHIGEASSCAEYFDTLKDYCKVLGLPIDGLVGSFNNIAYGQSLGMTSHHPKHSLAFKFYQEPNETTLLDIEWSVSRTGMINPVAILEPVEIDGTIVSRASLSNVSIIKELELGIGDTVTLIKAHQIIPQVTSNLTRSNSYEIPEVCPCCGSPSMIKNDSGRMTLHCPNAECHDRVVDNLVNFCGKNGMDIAGLSVETINTLVEFGYIRSFESIYELHRHQKSLEQINGFGKSKVNKLLAAIEESKDRKFENVIVGIGIPGIGKSTAKQIANHCNSLAVDDDNMIDVLIHCGMIGYDWTQLEGFGKIMSDGINTYIQEHINEIKPLSEILCITSDGSDSVSDKLGGKTFCITGKLEIFENRDALVSEIERNGGKVVSGVTAKTNYLITNDKNSGSSKNQKAIKYGTEIITEKEFLSNFN